MSVGKNDYDFTVTHALQLIHCGQILAPNTGIAREKGKK